MEIVLLPNAESHLLFWKGTNNVRVLKRIASLLQAIIIDPYNGIGKPEPLKYELTGKWSRRIDKENRLVYAVTDGTILVYTLKGHY